MNRFFDLGRFWKAAPLILKFLPVTLKITVVSLLIATFVAVLVAAVRVYRVPVLSTIFKGYLLLMRGIPYVVLMLLVYYYLPYLVNKLFGADIEGWDKLIFIGITFVLHEGAYIGEILRGAVESVPKVQKEAAYSVGLSETQTFLRIILPQSIKVAIPAYGSNLVEMFQNTAISYMIGAMDFIGRANAVGASMGHNIEPFVFVALVYVIISILIEFTFKYINAKYQFGAKVKVS